MTPDPINHLEDDDLMCAGFAAKYEHMIEAETERLTLEGLVSLSLMLVYCKVCDETYRWPGVLLPFYQSAHRWRKHPDYVCTFETLGRAGDA